MTSIEDLIRAPGLVVEIIDELDHDLDDAFEAQATAFAKRAEIEHPINKAPSTVAAAAVYVTGLLRDGRLTQQEIADVADVSTVAIRDCYPEIGAAEGFEMSRAAGTFPEPGDRSAPTHPEVSQSDD
ncbi:MULTISPECIES: transcription initiation factor IIB family protein [Halolamina]|uniref:Transcription factor TFIIB repeat-containing protein n=1 Tax=Halolamina pelagica TaxID=699431 RepID=A0A1I5VPA6_9EURY|nr:MULTISPECIES: hypothetical protein [Halolamina]NHX37843.1 hypothetical protein [Halolamina sp. R1-12]SFQ09107.1 Transcription factor TFIIB repeat-containing protein [Halolamina pelagica]